MKTVQLPQYNVNVLRAMLSLQVAEVPVPKPGPGEVVVKVHAATCNPSDIAFIRGVYNIVKPLPAIPGFEASGTVEYCGEGCTHLAGRKVSCFVQSAQSGTWAEYVLVDANDLIAVGDAMDPDQAAAFSVNPFTAWGLVEIAKMRESGAIIQNASGGQVAAFIRKLAAREGIRVIDIVRKKETAEWLKQEEITALVETDESFADRLKELAAKYRATTAFDAVGGALAGMIFNAMPEDSELVVYGGLSGKRIADVNEMDIIFKNKIISGFNLIEWKHETGQEEFEKIAEQLEHLFADGYLKTHFQDSVRLEDIRQGLKSYIGNMSGGKLLIKP